MARLPRIALDLTPVRDSRDLRLLLSGEFLSGLGTQAALVALPYQVYTQSGSAFLTGLLGAVELIPLVAMALLGGALADRADRRRHLRARRPAAPGAVRARRAAGRLRGGAERHALGDPPQPRHGGEA